MSAAVVFDLDGTLADTAADIAHSLNQVLAAHALQVLGLSTIRSMIGRGPVVLVERALRHQGERPDAASVARLSAAFVSHYARAGHRQTTLYPGVRDCLGKLTDDGVGIGVCSNKPQASCESLLSDLGIANLVSAVQGSGPATPTKPDPTTLLYVLHTLAAAPAQTLYVGDSDTDVMTARNAGVPVALVSWGYSDTPVTALGADAVIESLDDLPAVRAQLNAPRPTAGPPLRRSAGP